jgi:acetyltransferase-like isoleucine patch superfamily enzyme
MKKIAKWYKMLVYTFKGRPFMLSEIYPQYEIGRYSYGNPKIMSGGEGAVLKIGSFCSFASGVKIFLGGEHRIDWVTTYPFNVLWERGKHLKGHPKTKGDVIIGHDVWIGADAIIMSGVTIGHGAVIGARAVVAKDVEPYAVVVGNPARVIKKRFDDVTIQQLLEIAWWNFDDKEIESLLPAMLSMDIQSFIHRAQRCKLKEEDS